MEELIQVRKKHTNNFKKRKPVKIKVLNLKTNIETEWESCEKFANSINVKKNTLQKHIYLNKGQYHNKYKISYLT